jgi:hypothetical protein
MKICERRKVCGSKERRGKRCRSPGLERKCSGSRGRAWPGSLKSPTVVRGGGGFETKMLRKPLTREGKDGDVWESGIAREGVGALKQHGFGGWGRGEVEGGQRRTGGDRGSGRGGERGRRGMEGASIVRTQVNHPVKRETHRVACVVGKVVGRVPSSARDVDHAFASPRLRAAAGAVVTKPLETTWSRRGACGSGRVQSCMRLMASDAFLNASSSVLSSRLNIASVTSFP